MTTNREVDSPPPLSMEVFLTLPIFAKPNSFPGTMGTWKSIFKVGGLDIVTLLYCTPTFELFMTRSIAKNQYKSGCCPKSVLTIASSTLNPFGRTDV